MQKCYLFLLLHSVSLSAQEFTPPDTSAIRKNKIKKVLIYYTGTGTKHSLSAEMHYDQQGRCIYSSEGFSSYYYDFNYDEHSQVISSCQRSLSGKLIQGYLKDYYPNGKAFHVKVINERDSINPSIIYTYDTTGNTIREEYYSNGKMIRSYQNEYDANEKIIHRVDSTPGKEVFEMRNHKTVRQTYYNTDNSLRENCLIEYDAKGLISKTYVVSENIEDVFTVIYDDETNYHLKKNGRIILSAELIEWDRKFGWLVPRPKEDDYRLPYSDPVPVNTYKHEITRDKKGNITEDKILPGEQWMQQEVVYFTYEYEKW